jgi:hypothetical protein
VDNIGTIIIQLPSVRFIIYLRVYSTGQKLIIIMIMIIVIKMKRKQNNEEEEEEMEAPCKLCY